MNIIDFAEQYNTHYDILKGKWVVGGYHQQFEKDFLQQLNDNKFTTSLFSRQMYSSTLMATFIAYSMIFNKKVIAVFGPRLANSNELVSKVKLVIKKYIEKNPPNIDEDDASNTIDIFVDNKQSITLNNGSMVRAFSSKSPVCSLSVDMIFIDQAAFIPNLRELYGASVPALKTGGGIHMVSNPNGVEHFCQIYNSDSNVFVKGRYHYSLNSRYSSPEWLESMKEILPEDIWRRELELEFFCVNRPKNQMIQFRLTTELHDKLFIKAHEKKISISDYLRQLIDKDLRKEKDQ